MSLFSKLFGGGKSASAYPTETHNGFRITPAPRSEGGSFRLAARIEKDVDGETKTHEMIRADSFASADEAAREAVAKARVFIDQMGDKIFR